MINKNQIRLVRGGLFPFFLITVVLPLSAVTALGQETVTRSSKVGSTVEGRTYRDIPPSTEPCSPEECSWWERLREAGNKLLRKGDEKSKGAFVAAFLEGIEKSYRVPVKDRPPQPLVFPRPIVTSDLPLKERNGRVQLSVELMADASVGEIRVVESLGKAIDERCVKAVQNIIFLPAVKNGAFVQDKWMPAYSFFAPLFPR
jgi:hypothetical protein